MASPKEIMITEISWIKKCFFKKSSSILNGYTKIKAIPSSKNNIKNG